MYYSVTLFVVYFLFLVNYTTSHTVSGPHITNLNLLLPPKMTHPVEYLLQGSGGCFKWSWDHHDILSVIPEHNSSSRCSTSARVRSIESYSGRKETAVYATDIHTGTIIRCKVFIDHFSRIQIFHNSIKLDLDGLSTLRVRAFDNEDNVFSSLVGLRFMWQLMPETDGLPHHLVHVPLKNSPLSDSGGLCGDLNIQIQLEDSGVFSDLYVVRGTGIGHEIVSVQLLEPQFEHMGDKIVLTVAEAMSLNPSSPIFVLIGAVIHYGLKVIRGNISQAVPLPSSHHQWSVLNSSVAQVDTLMGLVHALRLGVTTVTLEDTRVIGHKQISSLHVVLPDNICIYLSPLSLSGNPVEGIEAIPSMARWCIMSGHQYLIQVKVFSRGPGAKEIYITESDDVKLYYNQSEHWRTFLVSDDNEAKKGWQNSRILKANSQGQGKLTASLTYFSGYLDKTEVLKVVQEVMVCDKVKFIFDKRSVVSESILLPWVPTVYQEVELKATGGCAKASSDYKWFSSNMAIVSVSDSGVVQAKKPGKATVKVVSIFDSLNYKEVVIEVSIPSYMVMLDNFMVETVVGSYLLAAVTMKASNGAYFYRCDSFSSLTRWKAGSESFIIVNATGEKSMLDNPEKIEFYASDFCPPCAWTYVYAAHSGRALLHATLFQDYPHFDRSVHGPIVLKASSCIAAYPPLIACQAGDGNQFGGYWFDLARVEAHDQLENLNEVYLVPGTHLDVMLLGGPEKWDRSVDFVENVEILDSEHAHLKDGALVHQLSNCYYRVLCQTLGNFKIIFRRGNMVGDDHPLPAIAEVKLSVTCGFPSSITLLADEPVNELDDILIATQADRSPGRIRVTPVTVENSRTIRIAAVGISDSGKPFANSSSLYLSWELSNCEGLAFWDDAYDFKMAKFSWERFLVLQNESGLCTVRATAMGFIDTMSCISHARLLGSSENVLTDVIRLQFVSTIRVNPEFSLLFFNHGATVILSITGGSCFLEAVVNDSRVAEVIQPSPGLQRLQLTLAPRGLGSALVTVNDMGLVPPATAFSVVRVVDVDWIRIISREEMSLMEGSLQSIDIVAGVDDGSTFDSSQYVYMDIRLHIVDHTVDLINEGNFSSRGGEFVNAPKFTILAKHIGVTTLYVSARQQSGHEIRSQPITVDVYAPPRIHPHDIFLVPGASYKLTVIGGPTIGVSIEYASLDGGTAEVHKSLGWLSAISPGNTTLLATVYGNGGTAICQAHGTVRVGVPSSMTLHVQSEKLGVGREMPIFPSLPEGDLFSFYELCKSYKWTVEDNKVLSFHEAEHLHGDKSGAPFSGLEEVKFTSYLDDINLGFIRVLFGRSAGRTNVAVSVSCDFISASFSQSRSYYASISLLVVSDLPLSLGVPMTWILPPHYITSPLLPSSSESYSHLDTQSREGTITYSLLRYSGGRNQELQKDAISIDGNRIQTTESNNIACIQAIDHTSGKVEIASCVRVAEVAQIRIASSEFSLRVINLDVGAELELPINYCDALGRYFHEAHNVIPFAAETNYPSIIFINETHIGNGNVYMKAIGRGRALVRVSISHSSQKSDYMLISVGATAHLYPQNPVHQGRRLLSLKGLNDQVFDMLSGEAQAVGQVETIVTIPEVDILTVKALNVTLTNVPFPAEGYYFSVKFSDTYKHKSKPLVDGNEILYDCRVEPSYIGYTMPWKDLRTDNSYCLFFPYPPEHLVDLKLKNTRSSLCIFITASLREASHISGCASAFFIGGFSILGMRELNMTAEFNSTTITILGNTDAEIFVHNWDVIKISLIGRDDFGIGGRAEYMVEVLRCFKNLKDKIIITLPYNGQSVVVDVNYKASFDDGMKAFLEALLMIFFLMTVFPWIFYYCFLKPYGHLWVVHGATPAPAPVTEHSSRAPQAFIDYVRETIDKTPYYRGRRFN